MSRRIVGTLIGVAVVLVLVGGGYLVWAWHAYKQWPWSAYPSRLRWCGRDWEAAGVVTRAQIDADNHDFHRAGDLPGPLNFGSVWTSVENHAVGFTHCKISDVWVQRDANRFQYMRLLGGP